MDKYVGEAEKNIRMLFEDAEDEWARRGSESKLHVIIFDEIDAIAKSRGSLVGDGSGVRDSCGEGAIDRIEMRCNARALPRSLPPPQSRAFA